MSNDPLEFLSNAGNHSNTWILIYGPICASLVVLVFVALWVSARRRKERVDFENAYREISQIPEIPKTAAEVLELPKSSQESPPLQVPTPQTDVEIIRGESSQSWMSRLRTGLTRTRDFFEASLQSVFIGRVKISDKVLETIHETLYRSDVGVRTADRLIDGIRKELAGKEADWPAVREILAGHAKRIFSESKRPLNVPASGPWVILIIGVNGVGKTTTIGKLAARFKAGGKTVMLCAADTFRAAAIEQLQVWGERNDVPVIKQVAGADPAAVAFDGVQAAKARGVDVLIIDTAGRLHSKTELMAELSKINKSIGKDLNGAPHETWIVLDATTGQNAVAQCKAFSEVTPLSGIVMTKLDGTAKGGVIIGIADQFKIPIRYIGVGETAADLREFSGDEFVEGLL